MDDSKKRLFFISLGFRKKTVLLVSPFGLDVLADYINY